MFYFVFNSLKVEADVNKELLHAKEVSDFCYQGNKQIVKISGYDLFSVGKCAFKGCSKLEEVYFGPEIRKIDSKAFAECPSLKDVWFPMVDRHAKVEIAPDAFESCGKICFHIFGLGCETCGNEDIEQYAKKHNFHLVGMI